VAVRCDLTSELISVIEFCIEIISQETNLERTELSCFSQLLLDNVIPTIKYGNSGTNNSWTGEHLRKVVYAPRLKIILVVVVMKAHQ